MNIDVIKFTDKNLNKTYEKYKKFPILKMYILISNINPIIGNLTNLLCEETNTKDYLNYHTSLIVCIKFNNNYKYIKIEKLLFGINIKIINNINNINYLKSIKLKNQCISINELIFNLIKVKDSNYINNYNPFNDNCFTFINSLLRENNLCLPKNKLINEIYKKHLNIKLSSKKKLGFSIKFIILIINFLLKFKFIKIIIGLLGMILL